MLVGALWGTVAVIGMNLDPHQTELQPSGMTINDNCWNWWIWSDTLVHSGFWFVIGMNLGPNGIELFWTQASLLCP